MQQNTPPTAVGSNAELDAFFFFFFMAAQLQAVTMTELAGMRAQRGFCPKCQAQKLRHVSSGGGMVFRQCADCGTVAVLGA